MQPRRMVVRTDALLVEAGRLVQEVGNGLWLGA
jgi:hypothetical protein